MFLITTLKTQHIASKHKQLFWHPISNGNFFQLGKKNFYQIAARSNYLERGLINSAARFYNQISTENKTL